MTMQGYVKNWFEEKGYGFLVGQTGEEFFFHASGMTRRTATPQAGQAVAFEAASGPRGPRAINVSLINE